MSENSGIAKFLNSIVLFVLDQVASGKGPTLIGYIVLAVLGTVWLYCSLKIYFDARERFATNKFTKYIFLLFGLITGPIGLLIYSFTRPRFTPDELDFIRIEHKFYYYQTSKVLDCMNCDAYVVEGQSYCTNCGTQNRFTCESCESMCDYDARFCSSCGTKQLLRLPGQEEVSKKQGSSSRNFLSSDRILSNAAKVTENAFILAESLFTKVMSRLFPKEKAQTETKPAEPSTQKSKKKK